MQVKIGLRGGGDGRMEGGYMYGGWKGKRERGNARLQALPTF